MNITFLTYYHRRNLPQVQCLIASLRKFHTESLIVAVVDDECWEDSLRVVGFDVMMFPMSRIENDCRKLGIDWGIVRDKRNARDTAWTFQSCYPFWAMKESNDNTFVYVDSDVQFLQSFRPILDMMVPQAFVGISEHHYPPGRENKSAGRFNNGLCIWRNTPEAIEFARGWGERTIAEMSPDKGYEQGELTGWPELLGDKCWIMPKNCNVGPWRLATIVGDPPRFAEDGMFVQSFHHHETRPAPGNNSFTIKGQVWNYTNYSIAPETLKSIHEPYGRMIEGYL